MENKPTYAIGSDGPVMYNGTVFKDQKQLNVGLSVAFIAAGFVPLVWGVTWLAWILWIFGILGLLSSGKKK